MLNEYNRKRNFKKTPEPIGAKPAAKKEGLEFVIQKHHARRLHYDFRLEIDGVLVSWAVPKGPSLDPAEKRLAVQTEDHPMDYSGFEGVIPDGEYGAGEVIVWDKGIFTPDDEGKLWWHDRDEAQKRLRDGLKKGKLSIFIEGEKLKGSWALVKLKNTDKDWLLIKHRDVFAQPGKDPTKEDLSVLTARSLADVKEGRSAKHNGSKKISTGKAQRFPTSVKPMFASLADAPFSQKGWVFEPKMDGIRAIAYIQNGQVRLSSRNSLDLTRQYPSLTKNLSKFKGSLVLDGEIIALNEQGRPSFQHLQQRLGLTKGGDVRSAETKTPIFYYVFDIMHCNGKGLEGVPLDQRRAVLVQEVMPSQNIRIIEQFDSDGQVAYEACVANGLEGVVAKRIDGLYESGRRSKSWLKIKSTMSAELLICGFTEGTGARNQTFGALLLGQYNDKGELIYAGGVGTGFDDKKLKQLMELMRLLITNKCPFRKKPPGKLNPTWVKPELIAEIKFAEWTQDKILRAPVFLRLRDDITPQEVKPITIVETEDLEPVKAKSSQLNPQPDAAQDLETVDIIRQLTNDKEKLELDVEGNKIAFSNLNKVFWPGDTADSAVTKRDYVIYLAKVAPYLLPHLKDRLITLVRFPNGITQGRFYQKHWEHKLPPFVETIRYFTEHINADQDFLFCNNLSTLLWLGQIADLELHTSHTRNNPEPDAKHLPRNYTSSIKNVEESLLNYPDYLVFDLDPYLYSGKEKKGEEPELHRRGFEKACDLAFWLKGMLDSLKIDSFIKTSGRTGLHIYIPIIRTIDYSTVRALSEIIGRQILKEHPDDVTMDWAVVKRTGKVFLDHNMNARGKTLASIYSPRVAPEATISTPVSWDELRNVYPHDFTMRSVPERLEKIGDLWADILDHKNDLEKLLINTDKSPATLAPKTASKQRKKKSVS